VLSHYCTYLQSQFSFYGCGIAENVNVRNMFAGSHTYSAPLEMLVKYSCQHLKRRIAAEALVLEERKKQPGYYYYT
jgi:hypothetical protein